MNEPRVEHLVPCTKFTLRRGPEDYRPPGLDDS